MFSKYTWPFILIAAVTSLGYAGAQFNVFSPPCSEPIKYHIGTIDPRFKISEAELENVLSEAAGVWNAAAGKTVVTFADEGDIAVNLDYTPEQQTSELGEAIDAEQAAYDNAKATFDSLISKLEAAKRKYETLSASYEAKVDAYEKDVAYWNARGGAPSAQYQQLQARQRELNKEQETLNAQSAQVNAIIDDMNNRVDTLNQLAEAINQRVDVYNANAHTDFDQGRYIEDEDGKRITIREFTERTELERVLAHELGHAIGLDHVENPDSIMYSYNVGTKVALTAEDTAELVRVCKLD